MPLAKQNALESSANESEGMQKVSFPSGFNKRQQMDFHSLLAPGAQSAITCPLLAAQRGASHSPPAEVVPSEISIGT